MAFKMKGFTPYTKHEGPHPKSGMIQYDKETSKEYVEFDDGSKVYGSWNEMNPNKANKIDTEREWPLTTGEMYISEEKGSQQAVMLDESALEENQPQETDEGPTKEQAGPRA